MAQVGRALVALTGWSGAPGVNVVHFAGAGETIDAEEWLDFQGRLHAAYTAFGQRLAGGVHVQIPQECEVLNVATGVLENVLVTEDPQPEIISVSGGPVNSATQCVVRLHTGAIINGRRLQGRIFGGPLASGAVAGNAVIPAVRADFVTGVSGLIFGELGSTGIVVYHRPKAGNPGAIGLVSSVTTWEIPGVLRSRRT